MDDFWLRAIFLLLFWKLKELDAVVPPMTIGDCSSTLPGYKTCYYWYYAPVDDVSFLSVVRLRKKPVLVASCCFRAGLGLVT